MLAPAAGSNGAVRLGLPPWRHAGPIERDLLDFAVDLVREAGEATLRWFRSPDLAVDSKADGTPVTAADRAAERLVRERIAGRFPDDGVLGEEEPERPGRSGRRWIVDPIDGTKAFTRGVPLYSTLLALHDEHGPALGCHRAAGARPGRLRRPWAGLLDATASTRPGQRPRRRSTAPTS